MPLYEYSCLDCGQPSEVLIMNSGDNPVCTACGSRNMEKLLSAPASSSGVVSHALPGPGDTACCGSHPGQTDCAGPGSCCGKRF